MTTAKQLLHNIFGGGEEPTKDFRFSGPASKGAMREVRARKRAEAEERQKNVLPENTRAHRRDNP